MKTNTHSNRHFYPLIPTGITRLFALIIAISILLACDKSSNAPQTIDASKAIQDIPEKVIFATYVDLGIKSNLLVEAVSAFAASPTEENLSLSKQAWRGARRPWEQSEGFLFGPVVTDGVDASIDSWPLNKVDLDNVMKSEKQLTKAVIDALEKNLKGFHTIEYLLFGTGNKTTKEFTDRELEYLKAVTSSFKGKVDILKQAWDKSGGNFLSTVQNAGKGSAIYGNQRQILEELINGMVAICDEVANGKISNPFDLKNRTLEESQFSNNSTADFADNIRSVRNIYLGIYTIEGMDELKLPGANGFKSLIEKINPTLALQVENEIDLAIAAILQMTPTFGEAIFNSPAKVEAARTAVKNLMATLEGPVTKAILP